MNSLLDGKLIACANLIGEVESIYELDGKRENSSEVAVLFKTNGALLEQAIQCLVDLHPYDTPAILGWRCDVASAATGAWLGQLTGGN